MARSLIVPLDGSAPGEVALPWAAHLARTHGLTLVLARVVPWPVLAAGPMGDGYVVPGLYDEIIAAERSAATEYLDEQRRSLEGAGVSVEIAVREGGAAEGLMDLADERDAYAIVMATHGRGGITRVLLGSVAERVLHDSNVPVFLVRPQTDRSAPAPALNRLLVPLDGSLLAERALDIARDLAPTGATLVLVRAEPPAVHLVGGGAVVSTVVDEAATERATTRAREYLLRLTPPLEVHGLSVIADARVGWPEEQIPQAAREHQADVIVMATHGHTGPARWMLGSVADQIVRHAEHPVLLVSARALVAQVAGSYTVRDVMTRDLETVRDDEPLIVALRKLLRRRVSGLPVLDAAGELVGVLSEQDLLEWQYNLAKTLSENQEFAPADYARHLKSESVRRLMSHPPTTIADDAPLNAAIGIFRERGVRRLPVTRDGKLVGIVSRADVLKAMASQWQAIASEGVDTEL